MSHYLALNIIITLSYDVNESYLIRASQEDKFNKQMVHCLNLKHFWIATPRLPMVRQGLGTLSRAFVC